MQFENVIEGGEYMEKENLLEKGFWHLADIRAYACCGTVKASKIRQEAIKKYDGLNPLFPTKVRRDAVLKVLEEKAKFR